MLWLSRLARPDVSFAVGRLTTRVSKWTDWEDRQTLRLICYQNSTRNHVFRASADPSEKPELLVFTDSDFASCPYTCRSTSGVIYVIRTGEVVYFPILWSSRKQGSTARSTAEAELITFASALFGEVLNLHEMPSTPPTWQSLLNLNKTIKLQSQSFDLGTAQNCAISVECTRSFSKV